MKPDLFNLIKRSLVFYRKSSAYQVGIVFILAAIITGSLLTGYSVRESLRTSSNERLGNTDLLISSGLRYFDSDLSAKTGQALGDRCVSVLETTGYCQNFATGATALNTNIYGVTTGFFLFHGNDTIIIPQGAVAINQNLADHLGIAVGDELILHFNAISSLPSNAPFAPSENGSRVKVMRVSHILNPKQSGNFSLGISQVVPMNVFIDPADIESESGSGSADKSNRILVENRQNITIPALYKVLKQSLSPADIGLAIRKNDKTGTVEIVSERIFFDQEMVDEISRAIPSARPLVTYLANRISRNDRSTPYSFVAGLPGSISSGIPSDRIVINRWLAEDLNASVNDTVRMSWYSPSANGRLDEKSSLFIVDRIVGMDSIWGDSLLMPAFPGISGTRSCSDWDAGIAINIKLIRKKDEAYWNRYQGTPKAFIGFEKGKELWGSNFGPATAMRFPESITMDDVNNSLTGSFDPGKTGFSINNVRAEAMKAAREGVDFSTLFLSLGFFIILSSLMLLALSVSVFFDSRKDQVYTYFALGFTDKWIRRLLFLETSAIAIAGALPGVFAGGLINWLIIKALNSVWSGAVQTNTLGAHFAFLPLLAGFIFTIIICLVLLAIRTRRFLANLKRAEKACLTEPLINRNYLFLFISLFITVFTISLSFFLKEFSVSLSFAGGVFVFITLVLLVRQYFIGGSFKKEKIPSYRYDLSRRYYSFNPSHGVTPVIFIAAGIFAVFITGVNRLDINDKMKEPSGGTGGFMLWGESAFPVKQDLNSEPGRREFGLNEDKLKDISFVLAKRSAGNDASCLNLNHVSAPPLLGLDPSLFISKGSFTFATVMKEFNKENPWKIIDRKAEGNTVYGVADQSVLQWGLKISPGDTLKVTSESGQPLNVIIAAGLKSSVFQGFVIIGAGNFDRYFPSVGGSSVFLVAGNPLFTKTYQDVLEERFANYGVSVMPALERLASFFEVTNTYLSVFTILGAFGIVLGVAGLGFILLRNYNQRKREFALLVAAGYSIRNLRNMVMRDQLKILFFGILTGSVSAMVSTLPSLKSGADIPWVLFLVMILSVSLTGLIALVLSVRVIKDEPLIRSLRKE